MYPICNCVSSEGSDGYESIMSLQSLQCLHTQRKYADEGSDPNICFLTLYIAVCACLKNDYIGLDKQKISA